MSEVIFEDKKKVTFTSTKLGEFMLAQVMATLVLSVVLSSLVLSVVLSSLVLSVVLCSLPSSICPFCLGPCVV